LDGELALVALLRCAIHDLEDELADGHSGFELYVERADVPHFELQVTAGIGFVDLLKGSCERLDGFIQLVLGHPQAIGSRLGFVGQLNQHQVRARIDVNDPNRQVVVTALFVQKVSLDPDEVSPSKVVPEDGNSFQGTETFRDVFATNLCHTEAPDTDWNMYTRTEFERLWIVNSS
jgi:hypothetical protein